MLDLFDSPVLKVAIWAIFCFCIIASPFYWICGKKGPIEYKDGRLDLRADPNEAIFKK